jgi:hypothetical protein
MATFLFWFQLTIKLAAVIAALLSLYLFLHG